MSSIPYLDFDLQIQRIGDGYRAHVLTSPAGQASTDFGPPFLPLELENFLLRVGRTRRGTRRIDSTEMDAAKAFGARLFETAFGGEVRSALRSSLAEADRHGAGLRLRLRLADTPELTDIPWEYLYDPTRHRFLTLSLETPLVRYLDLPERIQPLGIVPPLKVLVMISSPQDYPQLDVEGEWMRLREALGDLEQRRLLVLERLDEATLVALQRRLRRVPYHVFHFIGHGGFDQQAQDGQLILEEGSGRGRPVSGRYLGMLLHDVRSLRLAVLNACEGARTSRTDPFAGTAQSLAQSGIPAVIAMQFEITDEAAIAFAHEFYQAVADGYPVDAAVTEARKAIFAQGNDVEWGTPVLYLRSPNGQIFDVAAISPPPPTQAREQEHLQGRLTVLFEEAHAAKAREDWPVALEKLQAVLALEPTHAEATAQVLQVQHALELHTLYNTAQAHDAAGRWQEALASFRQIQEQQRDYKDVSARIETIRRILDRAERAPTPGPPPAPPPVGSGSPRQGRSKTRWTVGTLILLLGLSAVCILIFRPSPTKGPVAGGQLLLIGRLAGVEVWVGDERIGEMTAGSALVRDALPPGRYRLKAQKAGYAPLEQEVEVRAGQRTEVAIDLQPLPGSVVITSRVAGLEVRLGDDKLGETRAGGALVRDNLKSGSYRVKAQKPGYQPWERDIQITANQRTEVVIDLTPLPGSVAIIGRVAGAEVWVGEGRIGETTTGSPLVRDNLPPGRYRVKAQKPGYQPWEQEVQVSADKRTEVAIDLQPLPGTVSITSRVTGVEVWVGPDKLGETTAGSPLLRDTLPPGSYRVKALKSGYQPWEQDIQITASQRTEVVIDLQPLPGTVSITSHMAGVEVWVGTDKLGETRLGSPLMRDNLPPGSYRIKARKPGYQPWEQDIQVSADKRTEVTIDLQPLPGTVLITSLVTGVEVWVGNDKLGETSAGSTLVRDNLPPGRYRVKAQKPGYHPWEQDIQVSTDKRTEVVIDLQPLPGTVLITSLVTGVEVWMGNDKLGEATAGSPLLRDNLPPGRYRVKAQKPGYQPWEQEVQVSATKRTEVVIDLQLLPGTVSITSRVTGVEVWIGTDKLGETRLGSPLVRDNLPPGRYRVKALKPGYQPWEQEVQVSADKRTEVAIDLQLLPGTVSITSRVTGVEVWVGTDKLGETTAGSSLLRDNLPPGSYRVKALKSGYQLWEQEVQITAGKRMDMVLDLTPLPGSAAITGHVAGAEVWIGTDKLGETTAGSALVRDNLPPGSYRIKAQKQGYRPWEREVQVTAGKRTDVVIELTPLPELGTLVITGRVSGAEVWVGTNKIGKTTSAGSPLIGDNLTPGSYWVKAVKRGYQAWEQEIQVNANQRTEVVIDLQLLKPQPKPPVGKPRSEPPEVRLPPTPPVGKPPSGSPEVKLSPKPPVGKSEPEKRKIIIVAPTP